MKPQLIEWIDGSFTPEKSCNLLMKIKEVEGDRVHLVNGGYYISHQLSVDPSEHTEEDLKKYFDEKDGVFYLKPGFYEETVFEPYECYYAVATCIKKEGYEVISYAYVKDILS